MGESSVSPSLIFSTSPRHKWYAVRSTTKSLLASLLSSRTHCQAIRHVRDRATSASLHIVGLLCVDWPRHATAFLPDVASRIVTGIVAGLCTTCTAVWERRTNVMESLASGMASVCGGAALRAATRLAATL